MQVSDEEIAKATRKTVEEIEMIKAKNPEEYEIMKYGALCVKLSLREEDLERFSEKVKEKSAI